MDNRTTIAKLPAGPSRVVIFAGALHTVRGPIGGLGVSETVQSWARSTSKPVVPAGNGSSAAADGNVVLAGQDHFVGRQHELRVLTTLLRQACAGRPRLLLIEGPAGAGKTALVDSFLPAAADNQLLRVSGEPGETAY